ncbi:MAG: hypothetical protein INR66_26410, partial [Gordonia polyisoprenivorans]|nr:hypothetical protein [Gordonia polyisoprenivorans]
MNDLVPPESGRRAGPSLSFVFSFVLGGAVVIGAIIGGLIAGIHSANSVPHYAAELHPTACTTRSQDDCYRDERVTLASDGSDSDDNWWIVATKTSVVPGVARFTVQQRVPVDQDYAKELRYPQPATFEVLGESPVRVITAQRAFPTENDPRNRLYGAIRSLITSGYLFLVGVAWLFAYVALALLTRVWRISSATWRRAFTVTGV